MYSERLIIQKIPINKVDYTLRTFRLLPDMFNDDEKSIIEPYEDSPLTLIKLLSVILERKVHATIGIDKSCLDENIKLCLTTMGFQEFYADRLYGPFDQAIKKHKPTNWAMLSVREWAYSWLENILFSIKR
jgi:hypothetical protein